MLTLDCGEYAVKISIFTVSRVAYCTVTKYEGPRESCHLRPGTAKEIVDSAVVVGSSWSKDDFQNHQPWPIEG